MVRGPAEEASGGRALGARWSLKVVTESVKKTDRHDAATIAEFLEKNMLLEALLRESPSVERQGI